MRSHDQKTTESIITALPVRKAGRLKSLLCSTGLIIYTLVPILYFQDELDANNGTTDATSEAEDGSILPDEPSSPVPPPSVKVVKLDDEL